MKARVSGKASTVGLPAANGEKRTKPKTVHLYPALETAIEQLRKHDDRTVSTFICRVLERDPVVQSVLQQINKTGRN